MLMPAECGIIFKAFMLLTKYYNHGNIKHKNCRNA